MNLSPEQRDALQRLLEAELRAAWRAALARGATPDVLAALTDEHRRVLEPSLDTGEERPRGFQAD